jgi:hypothetical protein
MKGYEAFTSSTIGFVGDAIKYLGKYVVYPLFKKYCLYKNSLLLSMSVKIDKLYEYDTSDDKGRHEDRPAKFKPEWVGTLL